MSNSTRICGICAKAPQSAYNRPKSQHKTKRIVLPNLQKWNGFYVCTRCRKTINKVAGAKA